MCSLYFPAKELVTLFCTDWIFHVACIFSPRNSKFKGSSVEVTCHFLWPDPHSKRRGAVSWQARGRRCLLLLLDIKCSLLVTRGDLYLLNKWVADALIVSAKSWLLFDMFPFPISNTSVLNGFSSSQLHILLLLISGRCWDMFGMRFGASAGEEIELVVITYCQQSLWYVSTSQGGQGTVVHRHSESC